MRCLISSYIHSSVDSSRHVCCQTFGASGTVPLLDLPGAFQPSSVSVVFLHVCISGRMQAGWRLLIMGDMEINNTLRRDLSCMSAIAPALQPFKLFCLDSSDLGSTGSLPVEWDLQRVGDMGVGVELENWVEPSRPCNDKEKLHDFIVQEGLLQLQPPVGKLGPGESTTWTITYRRACVASPEAVHVAFVTCHVTLPPGTDAGLRQSLEAECFYNMS